MQRFVLYKRVSTKRQGESGLGLDAQTRDIDLFLSSYADDPHEVIGTFTDVVSGKIEDRPELQKAIELAKSDGATLLVAKLDRLSRKASQLLALMDDRRLSLRVAQMPHADKFSLHIYAALAEQERDFISKRTKAALAEAKARGVLLGGRREGAKKRHEAVREQATRDALRVKDLIVPLRESGKTLQEIANSLNASKVTTPRGGKWHPTSVKNALDRLGS